MPLAPKHARFVDEYLIDLCGKDAAIRAGFSPGSAEHRASMLLTRPDIRAELAVRRKALQERTEVTTDRVVRELARIAFSDIRNVISWKESGVHFYDSAELSDDAAAAVAEVQEKRKVEMDGKGDDAKPVLFIERKVKMYDKLGALKTLAQYLGMIGSSTTIDARKQTIQLPSGMTIDDLRQLRDELRQLSGA